MTYSRRALAGATAGSQPFSSERLKRQAVASPPSALDRNHVIGKADRASTGTRVQPEVNAPLRRPTESERLATLPGRPPVVHPWACAGVELRHVPLTMHAAKTELAPERRAIERIKRKATAMAIATATETSFADEVETEPDLELHLRGRSCRCPSANVKAYRDEDEWVCHTCGHQLSPRVASLLTLTTRKRAGEPPPPQTRPRRKRSTPRLTHRTIPLDSARSTSAG